MRALLAVLATALVVLPAGGAQAGAQEKRPYPWDERVEAASRYARLRHGRVAFAVVDPSGRVRGRNIHERHRSASVVKAMLLVSYLNRVRGRPLNGHDKALLRPMITRSDNGAATRVRNIVGNARLVRLARRVKMKDFATSRRSWGSTQTSPYDQARLFWRIDAFVPRRHRVYARALLANVTPSQRWGLPPALPSGWRIYFKGGWVPPRLVNQVGLLERANERVAIAVFTDGDPSFGYGQGTVTGVARKLLLRVNDFAL